MTLVIYGKVFVPLSKPITLNVFSLTFTLTSRLLSHFPAFRLAHASEIFLATERIRAIVCSATAWESQRGWEDVQVIDGRHDTSILLDDELTTIISSLVMISRSRYLKHQQMNNVSRIWNCDINYVFVSLVLHSMPFWSRNSLISLSTSTPALTITFRFLPVVSNDEMTLIFERMIRAS